MDNEVVKSLILRISQGDEPAFDELYAITASKLFAVSFNILKDKHLAQDVMQEVYLTIAKKACKILGYENICGAIVVIAKNISLNMLKKRKRSGEVWYDKIEIFGQNDKDINIKNDVEEAIERLNPPKPEIIRLKYYSDLTVREIANLLGMSKSSVQREISKAEQELKKILADYS